MQDSCQIAYYFILPQAVTVLQEGLAGAFIWSVEMDDFRGHCGGPKYPLIRTVYEVFTQHPLSANTSPPSSAQLRVSNAAHGHGVGARASISSAAATQSHHAAQQTSAHHAGVHQGSIGHSSLTDSHHISSSGNSGGDHLYEHDPDADGHLSKPWQAMTDYDYEYYHWDDESSSQNQGTETHVSVNAAASSHSPERQSHASGPHHGSSSDHSSDSAAHKDHHYEHGPDADGHLSKPWQAMTDYDYEYYNWDDGSSGHSHDATPVHLPVSAAAAGHSHETPSHGAVGHASLADSHHVSKPSQHHDYIYEHNADADGHLSKPWQAKSDYDYEYYDWGGDHGHNERVSTAGGHHGHMPTTHSHGDYHDRHHHSDELSKL